MTTHAEMETCKIVFLCSGGGGNLRFVDAAIRLGWIENAELSAVLSDRECPANRFARSSGIETQVSDFSPASQLNLLTDLCRSNPAVIVTTVNKIQIPELVQTFRGRLVNLHYSLLPAFSGLIGAKPLRQALEYGAKFVGTTVHLVNEGVDTGKPIVQSVTSTRPADNEASLMDVVFRCGCISLLTALLNVVPETAKLSRVEQEIISVKRRLSFFSPAVTTHGEFFEDSFWDSLKV
jgi:phosphoribosylglycinamide formyltransferase-1